MGLGPELSAVFDVKADSTINQLILIFGSSYILFDGGASLRLKVLKEVWITILVISTFGVLITTAITGFAALHLLGIPLITALLLGSTVASTDPATVVPVGLFVKKTPSDVPVPCVKAVVALPYTVVGVVPKSMMLTEGATVQEIVPDNRTTKKKAFPLVVSAIYAGPSMVDVANSVG